MGVAIPGGGFSEDRASGALVIDGGLRFDRTTGTYLEKTFSSAGNRTTWTWSGWVKKLENNTSQDQCLFGGYGASNDTDWLEFGFGGNSDHSPADKLYWTTNGTTSGSSALLRDNSGWMHIVFNYNGSVFNVWSNGISIHTNSTSGNYGINGNWVHRIGKSPNGDQRKGSHIISQVYFIDGQALGPGYFGYTDRLTKVWRPKKFRAVGTTINDGTVWSSGIPGNTLSGYPATNGFDGNTSTFVYANNGTTMTWTAPKPVRGEKIEVYVYAGNTHPIVLVNGKSTGAVVGGTAQQNVWVDVTDLVDGQLETITAFGQNIGGVDRSSGFSAVRVDGVIMIDSTTTNLSYGTNGFYLPLDGSAPIGQDQSGRGNNWTPVNFGGSNTIEKATGALPILNTDGGGKVARVGVRTDATVAAGVGTCVLAMPLVGVTSDFSNQIDSRSTTQSITNNGGATGITTISNFYGGSYYFDGSNDYLSVGSPAADWKFLHDGNVAFTVECWLYYVSFPGIFGMIISTFWDSSADTGLAVFIESGDTLRCDLGNGPNTGYFMAVNTTTPVQKNKWSHIAITYDLTTLRMFLDGVLIGSSTTKNTPDTGNPLHTLYIGSDPDTTFGSKWLRGYLQDVRVYKGLAKYTSNFIPASTDPDIVPDSPSGVSYSSNVALVPSTDGAVAFDGSGDYLSIADSADFAFGSGDFTIETFAYLNPSNSLYFGQGDGGTPAFVVYGNAVYIGPGVWTAQLNFTAPPTSKWFHWTLVRSGNTLTTHINGISLGSSSFSTPSVNTQVTSNLRIAIGSNIGSQYTGNADCNVSVVRMYNRALSAEEVLQNYNATKKRFGL